MLAVRFYGSIASGTHRMVLGVVWQKHTRETSGQQDGETKHKIGVRLESAWIDSVAYHAASRAQLRARHNRWSVSVMDVKVGRGLGARRARRLTGVSKEEGEVCAQYRRWGLSAHAPTGKHEQAFDRTSKRTG